MLVFVLFVVVVIVVSMLVYGEYDCDVDECEINLHNNRRVFHFSFFVDILPPLDYPHTNICIYYNKKQQQ